MLWLILQRKHQTITKLNAKNMEYLAKQGHTVYGAARRVEKMEQLKAFGVKPIRLDVTRRNSVFEISLGYKFKI